MLLGAALKAASSPVFTQGSSAGPAPAPNALCVCPQDAGCALCVLRLAPHQPPEAARLPPDVGERGPRLPRDLAVGDAAPGEHGRLREPVWCWAPPTPRVGPRLRLVRGVLQPGRRLPAVVLCHWQCCPRPVRGALVSSPGDMMALQPPFPWPGSPSLATSVSRALRHRASPWSAGPSLPAGPPCGWQAAPRLCPEPAPESLLALRLDSGAAGVTTAGLFRTWSVATMGFWGFLEPW